jgi:hypothetical protein
MKEKEDVQNPESCFGNIRDLILENSKPVDDPIRILANDTFSIDRRKFMYQF